ncbi:hypothetical protein [Clostridium sp. AF21-20LB]
MESSFVIAVYKEKAAKFAFRSVVPETVPGTGVIAHGFSTGGLFTIDIR